MVNLAKRLLQKRIINFMAVGVLTFAISLAVYYPLTLFFQYHVEWLEQVFYLPATIPATLVSVTCGYYFNKKWTFRDSRTKKMGLLKYQLTGMSTAFFDILLLFVFVQFGHIHYLLGTVLATLCMFLVRYFIVGKWVWVVKNCKKGVVHESI